MPFLRGKSKIWRVRQRSNVWPSAFEAKILQHNNCGSNALRRGQARCLPRVLWLDERVRSFVPSLDATIPKTCSRHGPSPVTAAQPVSSHQSVNRSAFIASSHSAARSIAAKARFVYGIPEGRGPRTFVVTRRATNSCTTAWAARPTRPSAALVKISPAPRSSRG